MPCNEDPESPLPAGEVIDLPSIGLIEVYALRDPHQGVSRSSISGLPSVLRMCPKDDPSETADIQGVKSSPAKF